MCIRDRRYRFANNDMADLEVQLLTAVGDGARFIMIATDGVFSMDGTLANLPAITALAAKYGAITMVDDCHATGFMGPQGRGTPAHAGVSVDILTGTLGKGLGGALGGYIAGPQPVIDLLRQRARPYLFSNALPPAVVGAALAALDLIEGADELRKQLFFNADYWRAGLESLGFRPVSYTHLGCREHLTVIEGQLRVRSGEDEQLLGQGDTARYPADRPHVIAAEAGAARALLIVQDS